MVLQSNKAKRNGKKKLISFSKRRDSKPSRGRSRQAEEVEWSMNLIDSHMVQGI